MSTITISVYLGTYGEDLGPEISRTAGGVRGYKVPSATDGDTFRGYRVPSATDGDIFYKIKVKHGKPTCSCVGFTLRKTCHHVNEPRTWTPIN